MKLEQSNRERGCGWLDTDATRGYEEAGIYPDGVCPWLYYSAYPYMLGLLFGADFMQGERGDANVSCPAKGGCKAYVRKRRVPDEIDDPRIGSDNEFAIFVEVVGVGHCPAGHRVRDRFIFPTCMKSEHMCPAAWYQAFPVLARQAELPECMSGGVVRCPDWDRPDMMIQIASEVNEQEEI